jgi:hypothetical protein
MREANPPSYGRLDPFRHFPCISGGTMPLYLDVHTISRGVATDDVAKRTWLTCRSRTA